jgi:HTH-type transcriptional regulator, competence development regulator
MISDQPTSGVPADHEWPEPGDPGVERDAPGESEPILGDILRRARQHQGLSLRQVEQRTGVSNAHLSQIERGAIRRPDPAILMNLAELYGLNYELVAEWSGYLETEGPRGSNALAGIALRLFVELDPVAQSQALEYLEKLRNQR